MNNILSAVATTCLLMGATVVGQQPARMGPDNKPLLNRPILGECMNRSVHLEYNGHAYWLSWREPWNSFETWDWFNGRNFCRERCMDLVSFETADEFAVIAAIMKHDEVKDIYTSGRKCNFQGKGCDSDHLNPINIHGWFWAGADNARIDPTNQRSPNSFWSRTGRTGKPQPDNYNGLKEGPLDTEYDIGITIEGLQEYHDEACLAVRYNAYGDGIKWHDEPCHFRAPIVCEDSELMIQLLAQKHSMEPEEVKKSRILTIDKVDEKATNVLAVKHLIEPPKRAPNQSNNFLVPPPPPQVQQGHRPNAAPHKIPPHTHHRPRPNAVPLARIPRHPHPGVKQAGHPARQPQQQQQHRFKQKPGFFAALSRKFQQLL